MDNDLQSLVGMVNLWLMLGLGRYLIVFDPLTSVLNMFLLSYPSYTMHPESSNTFLVACGAVLCIGIAVSQFHGVSIST